mgnify:FL=1
MKRNVIATMLISALVLTACGTGSEQTSPSSSTVENTAEESSDSGQVVTLDRGAVRAKAGDSKADGNDMTSIFGTLRNTTDEDLHVIGFTTSLGDASYEIHEVVDGVMRQKEGGFDIPAGGTHELAPGGDHFMIMEYADEIPAGETIDVTLLLDDGRTSVIPDVAVRTMLPGDEGYGDDGQIQDHSQH